MQLTRRPAPGLALLALALAATMAAIVAWGPAGLWAAAPTLLLLLPLALGRYLGEDAILRLAAERRPRPPRALSRLRLPRPPARLALRSALIAHACGSRGPPALAAPALR